MKKILLVSIIFCLTLVGCGKNNASGVLKELEKNIEKASGYYLTGTFEIHRNDNNYLYDVEVSYSKPDLFKVSLTNKSNDHNQVILKNPDGVYVLTPSLNKSFKFQSEWPYNNSQAYLLQTILNDIKNDKNREFKALKSGYEFTVKANYSNNKDLIKQRITLDKDYNVTEVSVLNNKDIVLMKMTFEKVDLKATFNDSHFELDTNVSNSDEDIMETASEIKDIVYPMYLPGDAKLTNQETIKTNNGERVILTFSGEKPFMLVQENISIPDNFLTVPVMGEPLLLGDTIGAMYDSTVTWVSNGIEYYLISNALSESELAEIASSISLIPVVKQ